MRSKPLTAFALVLVIAVAITVILLSAAETPGLYGWARGAALVGYLFAVLSIISSAYVRPLVRRYRQPFVRLHHWVSLSALLLLTLHPVLLVIVMGSPQVLTAAYTSGEFFRNGGSPALVAFMLAAAAALARARWNKTWRYIHWLNYLALVLGTIHAILAGTSAAVLPGMTWVFALAGVAGVIVYPVRRLRERVSRG